MAASISYSLLLRSLLVAGLALLPAQAAERPPKIGPAPPPAVPLTIKARRGEVTDIPLRIYGTRAQTLTFLIRTAPRSGKLSEPRNVADERAVVRYTPPTDPAVTRDSFTYAVRSTEGVSAAEEVKIEIVDVPAELITPAELKNTNLLVGETETLTVELINRGGSMWEGDVTTEAPWRVEPPAHYRIGGNERAIVHVTFAPDVPGEFRGELHYSTQPDRLTSLHGTALAALAIRPAALDLQFESLTHVRLGAFEVTNNTKVEQTVTIHSSERLSLEHHLTLAPGRTEAVTVQTRADDTDPLAEVVRFDAHDVSALLPVRAAAVPPPPPPASTIPTAPSTPAPATRPSVPPASHASEQPHPAPRPAPANNQPQETVAESEPEPRRVDPMALTRRTALTPTSVTIDWPASAKPEACHAEVRDLALKDGKIDITWRRVLDVQITTAGDRTRAVFTRLQPGQPYDFRIVAPSGDSGENEPVAGISLMTPALPPKPPLITRSRVLGIVLVILLTGVVGLRLRSRKTGL